MANSDLQCRYCDSGECKRKVTAYLISRPTICNYEAEHKNTNNCDGVHTWVYGEPTEVPICGKASVALQNIFKAHGNLNEVGQLLSVRYI